MLFRPMCVCVCVCAFVHARVCMCVCDRYLIAKLRRACCMSGLHHPPVKYDTNPKTGLPTGRVKPVPADKFPIDGLEPAGDTATDTQAGGMATETQPVDLHGSCPAQPGQPGQPEQPGLTDHGEKGPHRGDVEMPTITGYGHHAAAK